MSIEQDRFSDLVVHIGYHKTGSTLLQNRLFDSGRGLWSNWEQPFYHENLLLVRPDSSWARKVRRAFLPGIETARGQGLRPVLSCEALSGDVWRLGQANGYGNFHVAELIAEAFPGARVAVVHREQRAMIVSLYKHSVRSHWRFGLDRFLDQNPIERGMPPILNFGFLEYSYLAERYQQLMGSSQVLLLPFELLKTPDEWSRRWSDFLGVEVRSEWFAERDNPGYSALTARSKRIANYLIPATAEPNRTRTGRVLSSVAYQVDGRVPASLRTRSDGALKRAVNDAVGSYFDEDNARLADIVGDDWSDWGYGVKPGGTNAPADQEPVA